MLKLCSPLLLTVAVVFAQPSTARAEPFTFGRLLLAWLIDSGISAGFEAITGYSNPWDVVTGAPKIRDMHRQLEALALSDKSNAREIARLREALNDRMTRAEVESLLMSTLSRVDRTLADHAARLRKLESDTKKLQSENQMLKDRLARQEGKTELQGKRIDGVEIRVDGHEKWIKDQELRIAALERKVAVFGTEGFSHYHRGEFEKALQSFETALENDPSDPGYYFGKALALKKLSRSVDAEKAIKTGSSAEKLRAPGQWYRLVMERVQGVERQWLETTRKSFSPVVVGR